MRSFPDSVVESLRLAINGDQWHKYHGNCLSELGQRLQTTFQCQHAVLCCSGTIAVELALRGAGVNTGDEVILAGYDYPGNFRAIEAIGAIPVLVDVIPNRWTIDPSLIPRAVSGKTKAILASHLHGYVADIESIRKQVVTSSRPIRIVEDACQAPGAKVNGQSLGSLGDVSTLSFGGSKLLTSGRGGAVLCNDDQIRQRVVVFSERGSDAFPLSELQAASLIPQLDALTEFTQTRIEKLDRLIEILSGRGITLETDIHSNQDVTLAFYKLPLAWPKLRWCLEEVASAIAAEGIPAAIGFRGFTNRSSRRCRKPTTLDHSTRASKETLLLHHSVLDAQDDIMEKLADTLSQIFDAASRNETN